MPTKVIDLTGQTFGHLTVIRRSDARDAQNCIMWECSCICGGSKVVRGYCLKQRTTISCGCRAHDMSHSKNVTHGMSKRPEFGIWIGMKSRCLNPNAKDYASYSLVGISQEWAESFVTFFADMGPRPSPKHTIDRIKNERGYSKENCRWATQTVQQRNRSNNRLVTMNGEIKTVAAWAEQFGISAFAAYGRLNRGWTPEKAFSTPARNA